MENTAYIFSMKNLSLHIFAPLLAVIDFLIFDRNFKAYKPKILLGFILPLFYLSVTLLLSIKGISYSNGSNYPYYFLDYRFLGWLTFSGGRLGVLWWIIIIAVLTFIVSELLLLAKRAITMKHSEKAKGLSV